jgi:hypothetical protein
MKGIVKFRRLREGTFMSSNWTEKYPVFERALLLGEVPGLSCLSL